MKKLIASCTILAPPEIRLFASGLDSILCNNDERISTARWVAFNSGRSYGLLFKARSTLFSANKPRSNSSASELQNCFAASRAYPIISRRFETLSLS